MANEKNRIWIYCAVIFIVFLAAGFLLFNGWINQNLSWAEYGGISAVLSFVLAKAADNFSKHGSILAKD